MKIWKIKYVDDIQSVVEVLNELQKKNFKIENIVYNHTTCSHEIYYTVEEENF